MIPKSIRPITAARVNGLNDVYGTRPSLVGAGSTQRTDDLNSPASPRIEIHKAHNEMPILTPMKRK